MYDFSPSSYFQVPWEDEPPEYVWNQTQLYLNKLKEINTSGPAAELFSEHQEWSEVCSIFFSNLIEGTGLELSDTATLARGVLKGDSLEAHLSEADPSGLRKSRREVLQHAATFVFLRDQVVLKKAKLTPDVILDAHRILMDGLTREGQKPVNAGAYRESSVNAGFHLFPPPAVVPGATAKLLEEYEERKAAGDEDPFALAAWLSYEFVSIHPFDDGNGRMCRLLLNMVLLSHGVPFCSALGFSLGHRQAKQHYLQCIYNARRHGGHPKRLAFVVLCSVRSTLAAFFEAVRIGAPNEYPAGLRMMLN